MRYSVIICRQPKTAPELWENHTYEIEAPDKVELQHKLSELLEELQEKGPGSEYTIQEVVNRSCHYVAQFASFMREDDPAHGWKKDQKFNYWDKNLEVCSDEEAWVEAKQRLESYMFQEEKSQRYTKLIKVIKITEEVIPVPFE